MAKKQRSKHTVRRRSSGPRQDHRASTPAPALRGEGAVEQSAVDDAVRYINDVYTAKGLETALEIGRYLLETFFDGDPATFQKRAGRHASFRTLADREDLLVSHSWLHHAVRVREQYEQLPDEIAQALPFGHHRQLLTLPDKKTKQNLAKRAVNRGLSQKALQAEVRKIRNRSKRRSRAGRPRIPAIVKGVRQVRNGLEQAASEPIAEEAVNGNGSADARLLLSEIEEAKQRLDDLHEQVRKTVEQNEGGTESE